jgi:hypothetical protein
LTSIRISNFTPFQLVLERKMVQILINQEINTLNETLPLHCYLKKKKKKNTPQNTLRNIP